MTSNQKVSYQWIVGKKDDLYWIIGSSGVSLFLLAAYFFLTQALPEMGGIQIPGAVVIGVIFLIWTFFFDSTHFFATYSRTFLDRQYHQNNKLMLYSSLLVLLIGPVFLLTPFLLTENHKASYSQAIFALIIFGSVLWGYYHLVRQHWGFITLYQKKNSENDVYQYSLDALLLTVGCLWPLLVYLNKELLTLPLLLDLLETFRDDSFIQYLFYLSAITLLLGGLILRLPSTKALGKLLLTIGLILCALPLWTLLDMGISVKDALVGSELFFRYVFITSLLVYSGYYLFYRQDWNMPKFLLMGSVLLTHNLILISVTNFLLISACLTIFHNIQYHRIIRYFNVNHYHTETQGLSVILTKKLGYFVFFALLFSLLVLLLRGSVTLAESGLLKMILITSAINGISLHHYFLDGQIWRTSKDKQLRDSLKLQN